MNRLGGSGSVGGNALVGHIGDVTAVSVGGVIGDDLGSAVGESNPVGSGGGVSVPLLVLGEVSAAIVVGYAVLVGVGGGGVVVGFCAIGGRTGGGAHSGGDKGGKDDNSLK